MLHDILDTINNSQDELLFLQKALVAIPALGPTNGGAGELAKVRHLADYLRQFPSVTCQEIQAPDSRVPCGFRPNLVARRPGQRPHTLWFIAHTDVVPAGDLTLWQSDPFVLRHDGDLIYGRGVEDNHQGLVSVLLVLRALEMARARTDLSLGILLAADEETGNAKGMEYIMSHHPQIFGPDDLVLIPDFGTRDGSGIEIAEKSVLWLKFTVQGRQCHASTPGEGINSLLGASALILALERLDSIFDMQDPLFDPRRRPSRPPRRRPTSPTSTPSPARMSFIWIAESCPAIPWTKSRRRSGPFATRSRPCVVYPSPSPP